MANRIKRYSMFGSVFPQSVQIVRGVYDFNRQGGAVGTVPLGVSVSPNKVVIGGYLKVITALAGTGASVGVRLEADGDIVATTAINSAPWSTTGRKSIIPAGTGATSVETTTTRALGAVISGANLTAGRFEVVLMVI